MNPQLRRTLIGALIVLAVVGYALLLWRGPWLLDGNHIRDRDLQPADGVVITGVRTALVALGAGVVAGLGLWYTHKKHQLDREQLKQTQEQFKLAQQQFEHAQEQFTHTQAKDRDQAELTREGQVTDRYVEAMKLLGSDNLHERLGGIYSLERIMNDSEKDHDTVVEVLSAFIRTQIQDKQEESTVTVPSESVPDFVAGPVTERVEAAPWAEDMKAACTVLARSPIRERSYAADLSRVDMNRLDLRGLPLTRANLAEAQLHGALLASANLAGALLEFAQLDDARLEDANMERAILRGAFMEQAYLARASLRGADLEGALLHGANLTGANLEDTRLEGANLEDANLHGANLSGTVLEGANLEGANLEGANLVSAYVKSVFPEGTFPQVCTGTGEAAMLPDIEYNDQAGD